MTDILTIIREDDVEQFEKYDNKNELISLGQNNFDLIYKYNLPDEEILPVHAAAFYDSYNILQYIYSEKIYREDQYKTYNGLVPFHYCLVGKARESFEFLYFKTNFRKNFTSNMFYTFKYSDDEAISKIKVLEMETQKYYIREFQNRCTKDLALSYFQISTLEKLLKLCKNLPYSTFEILLETKNRQEAENIINAINYTTRYKNYHAYIDNYLPITESIIDNIEIGNDFDILSCLNLLRERGVFEKLKNKFIAFFLTLLSTRRISRYLYDYIMNYFLNKDDTFDFRGKTVTLYEAVCVEASCLRENISLMTGYDDCLTNEVCENIFKTP